MTFLTVGTTFMRFDRLIKAVDAAVAAGILERDVVGQIGASRYEPSSFPFGRMMDKEEFDENFRKADLVVSHAGMGTMKMAIDAKKPLLVAPRLERLGEHVNDHQVWTARKFSELGHVVVLEDPEDLDLFAKKVEEARSFVPRPRPSMANALAEDILAYLDGDL